MFPMFLLPIDLLCVTRQSQRGHCGDDGSEFHEQRSDGECGMQLIVKVRVAKRD